MRLDVIRVDDYAKLVLDRDVRDISSIAQLDQMRETISHKRTKDSDEVDFVIEDRRGRVVGIEVKSGATLRRGDFNGLRKLKEAAGDRFVRGLVLHDQHQLTQISEKLHGAPLALLWA